MHSRLFPGDWIAPRHTAVAFDGRPIDITVPPDRLAHPGAHVYDWLKLIASEQRFTSAGYELPNLDGLLQRRSATRGAAPRSALDRMADRAVTRDAGDEVGGTADWTTARVTLHTSVPADDGTAPKAPAP